MAVECRSVVWMYGVYGSAISRRHISCAYLYRWLGIGTPHVNAVRCRSHISYHGSEISFPPINVEFIANSIETSPIVATSTYKRLCEIGKQKQIKWTGRWEKKQNKCDEENSSLVVSVCVCVSACAGLSVAAQNTFPVFIWNAVNWVERNSAKNSCDDDARKKRSEKETRTKILNDIEISVRINVKRRISYGQYIFKVKCVATPATLHIYLLCIRGFVDKDYTTEDTTRTNSADNGRSTVMHLLAMLIPFVSSDFLIFSLLSSYAHASNIIPGKCMTVFTRFDSSLCNRPVSHNLQTHRKRAAWSHRSYQFRECLSVKL